MCMCQSTVCCQRRHPGTGGDVAELACDVDAGVILLAVKLSSAAFFGFARAKKKTRYVTLRAPS